MDKEIYNMITNKRKTYKDMIDFCCDNLILNNSLIEKLSEYDIFLDVFCGDFFEYFSKEGEEITGEEYWKNGGEIREVEVYQHFFISERDAQRLEKYTNEIVVYNYDLDIYMLCVCHYGTAWMGVPSNWKKSEEISE